METLQGSARRRSAIVERPRLTGALDRTAARIRMLIGPAGWGKTTLAREWAARSSQRFAWYTAQSPSSDVAYLCVGLGRVAAEIVPGCDRRMCERLTATPDPVAEADVLAELLAEELRAWPDDAWLVVDDYDLVAGAEEAEAFVQTLVAQSPLKLLVLGRARPSWVSSRSILYGEVFELGQSALALSREEAAEVLSGWNDDVAAGLIALADGWPAVIGLAGLVPDPAALAGDIPDTLQAFLAEEIFQSLEPDVRQGLAVLALAPKVDREVAAELLGLERAQAVIRAATELGVLDDRGNTVDLHPLVRLFLSGQSADVDPAWRAQAIRRCLEIYRHRRDWDAAFELVQSSRLDDDLELLLSDALEELLIAARLSTIESWLNSAEAVGVNRSIFRAARAELDLRHGSLTAAQALAEGVLRADGDDSELCYRMLIVAGRATHLASREEEALEYFRRAESIGATWLQRREAQWGEIMCAAALESDDVHSLMDDLVASVPPDSPHELVRMADKQISIGLRFGAVEHVDEARRCAELLPRVDDPFARCSFRSMYSTALGLSCEYELAVTVAEELLSDAAQHRMNFALAYGEACMAVGLAGLRRFDEAHVALDRAHTHARTCNDLNALQNIYAIRMRALLQDGNVHDAVTREPPNTSVALKAMRGEVLAIRGLVLACAGRFEEALLLARDAHDATRAVEPRVLAAAVEAVVGVRRRDIGFADTASRLVDTAYGSGAVDLLVTAYRSSVDLLDLLLSTPATRERTIFAVHRAGDEQLLRSSLHSPDAHDNLVSALSDREREVYELVCEGLTTREIAEALFISKATVKAHVQHVFDKTGIRSRRGLLVRARGRELHQAVADSRSESDAVS